MLFRQVFAALLYGVSSLAIMFVNKIVLTEYGFPSFNAMAFFQTLTSLLMLTSARALGFISFPPFSFRVMREVFPLPLIFMLNVLSGLGGTKSLSIPMLTVLRRFTVVLTLLGEHFFLKKTSSTYVHMSVALMVIGAFIAAIDDLSFDLIGYALVFANNIFTASNGIVMKYKLESKSLGTFGLMYFNTIFCIPVIFLLMLANYPTDISAVLAFPSWTSTPFLSSFALSCILGFVLNYSVYLCVHVNSALTTTVVGCLKNVFSTYAGVIWGRDYIFSMTNFVGLNVSILGSLVYSAVKYVEYVRTTEELPVGAEKPRVNLL